MEDIEIDEAHYLAHYAHLQFEQRSRELARYTSLVRMEPEPNVMVSWEFLDAVEEHDRYTTIVGIDTPWARLFEMDFAAYRELTLEFFSTFVSRYLFIYNILFICNILFIYYLYF